VVVDWNMLAQIFGPPPVCRRAWEIAQDIGAITDPQTAEWAYRQLAPKRRPGDGLAAYSNLLKQIIDRSFIDPEEFDNETLPKSNTEVDGDRAGRAGGDPFGCQRVVRWDHRIAA
jgi:hypothetical protein